MRRLNKKGFTLIELLAVIVILGLVMVVTIPSVINAVKTARQSAYDEALTIIEKYVNNEKAKCLMELGNPDGVDNEAYNSEIFDEECNLLNSAEASDSILEETNYKNDIVAVTLDDTNGDEEYEVIIAPVTSGGEFDGVDAKGEIDRLPGVIPPIGGNPRPKF